MDRRSNLTPTPFAATLAGISSRPRAPPPAPPPPPPTHRWHNGVEVATLPPEIYSAWSTGTQTVGPVPVPAPLPLAAHSSSSDDGAAAKKIADLQAANADLYDKNAELQAEKDSLANELTTLKQDLEKQKKESRDLEGQVSDQKNEITSLNTTVASVQTSLATARRQTKERGADFAEANRVVSNLERELNQEKRRSDNFRNERDDARTDTDSANRRIDYLERQLASHNGDQNAQHFLASIFEELDEQFAEAGTDFTPDNVVGHIRRVSQQAAINRNISGDSNSSQQQNTPHSTRRGLGTRTTSNIAQELDAAGEPDDSGDEGSGDEGSRDEGSPNDIRVPKQRASDDFSSSVKVMTEQAQHISDLEKQIKKLESKVDKDQADHQATIERLQKEGSATLHNEYTATLENTVKKLFDSNADIYHNYITSALPPSELVKKYDALHQVVNDLLRQERLKHGLPVSSNEFGTSTEPDFVKLLAAEAERLQSTTMNSEGETQTEDSPAAPAQVAVRYIEKVRNATIFEAFWQSPAWSQFLLTLCFLFLLYFGLSGYQYNRMWSAANSHALHHLRYTQANRPAILGSFYSRLEDLVGYDSHLLG